MDEMYEMDDYGYTEIKKVRRRRSKLERRKNIQCSGSHRSQYLVRFRIAPSTTTLSSQYRQFQLGPFHAVVFLVLKFCIVVTRIVRQAAQIENETRERDVGDAPDKTVMSCQAPRHEARKWDTHKTPKNVSEA